MTLFNRIWSVTVGQPGETGVKIENLRTSFKVAKTNTGEPSQAEIQIYNAKPDTRNLLGTTGTVVRLEAGYAQQPDLDRLLCVMDVIDARTTQAETEFITTLTCKDGGNTLRSNKQSVSYSGGKSAKAILQDVVASAGLVLRDIGPIADDVFANGFSEAGPFADIMNKIAGKLNARWSIQNNEVQIQNLDEPAEFVVFNLSKDTGLIGTPERRNKVGTPESPSQKDGWQVQSLLLPPIEPGSRLQVESDAVSGLFRVVKVMHVGDSDEQPWYTQCEVEEF